MSNSCAGSSCTRTAFQGMKNGIPTYNVIPSGDISPISKLMESYLPNYPNSPNASHLNSVITTQLSGNYGNQGTSGRDNYNWDWRWDYDISAKNRVSTVGAMGHDVYATNFSNFYNDAPYTTGDLPVIVPKQYDVEDAYTITPHLTNQFKYGYTRFYMPIFAPSLAAPSHRARLALPIFPAGRPLKTFRTSVLELRTSHRGPRSGHPNGAPTPAVRRPRSPSPTTTLSWTTCSGSRATMS